jgi:hypothetical protein
MDIWIEIADYFQFLDLCEETTLQTSVEAVNLTNSTGVHK